jgi:hypothetical protein
LNRSAGGAGDLDHQAWFAVGVSEEGLRGFDVPIFSLICQLPHSVQPATIRPTFFEQLLEFVDISL